MALEIKSEVFIKDYVKVDIKGSLDTSTFDELDNLMISIVEKHPNGIVLDMSELEYISSAGIRVILKTIKGLAPDGKLLLVGLQPRVKAVFNIINALASDFFFETMDDVCKHLEDNY